MIDHLRGRVLALEPDLLLSLGPVTLRLEISAQTRRALPPVGREAELHAELIMKEERVELLGFASPEERRQFRFLTAVSGVGKRLALAVLSEFDATGLAELVSRGDADRLTKVPGVGKKTASRLLLELGNKLDEFLPAIATAPGAASGGDPRQEEALMALEALGMGRPQARRILEKVTRDETELDVEELIRRALATGVET